MIPDFKLRYEAIVTKTAWLWHTHTHKKSADYWNRTEDEETTPGTLSYLIFNKGARKHTKGKIGSLTSDAGKTGYTHTEH